MNEDIRDKKEDTNSQETMKIESNVKKTKVCECCGGSGKVHSHNPKCWECNGTGKVEE